MACRIYLLIRVLSMGGSMISAARPPAHDEDLCIRAYLWIDPFTQSMIGAVVHTARGDSLDEGV